MTTFSLNFSENFTSSGYGEINKMELIYVRLTFHRSFVSTLEMNL